MNPSEQPPRPGLEHAWERRLDAALRQLPELEAPASLVPNVMAAIRAREALCARPWWRRPATAWPPALRVAFAVAASAVLGAMILGVHQLGPEIAASTGARAAAGLGAKLAALWDAAGTLLNGFTLAARAIATPVRLAILAAMVLAQLLFLGAGGALLRSTLLPRRMNE